MISKDKIDTQCLLDQQKDLATGAMVTFTGLIRNHTKLSEKKVKCLSYEAQEELAEIMINEIVAEAKQKFDLNYAYCVHRVGD